MSDPSGRSSGDGISEERLDRLETRVEELANDLAAPPRGPLGLPRPPTPAELLRFADEHALPTAIAGLEAALRALELLHALTGAIRNGERDADSDRAESLARRAVTEFDRALDDLGEAVETGGLARSEQAQVVLDELRAVRDEIEASLEEPPREPTAESGPPIDDEPDRQEDTTDPAVAAELENIKQSVRDGDDADGDGSESVDGSTGDGAGTGAEDGKGDGDDGDSNDDGDESPEGEA